MEDGEVIDSTSARTVHTAETSIHLDTNKFSQVHGSDTRFSLKDIDIPTNVITRFDYIVDIPADAERQWGVVLEMSRYSKTIGSFEKKGIENAELRKLKRLIAYILTYTPKVVISDEIAAYKIEQLEILRKEFKARVEDYNSWQGLLTRLAISIDKYIKAITTSRFEQNATKEDVDLAVEFIKPKLDFVASLRESFIETEDDSQKRKNLITKTFVGQTVTKNDVHRMFEENEIYVAMKTVERDLADLAEKGKAKKGKRAHWDKVDKALSKCLLL